MCLSQLWAQNTERLNSKSYTLSSKNGGDAKVNSGLGSEHTEGGKVGANRGGGGKTKLSLPQGSSLCCSSLPLLFLFKRKSATLPIRTSWVHWFFRLKEEDALVAPARAVTRIHLGVGWDDRFFSLMPPYSCNRLVPSVDSGSALSPCSIKYSLNLKVDPIVSDFFTHRNRG